MENEDNINNPDPNRVDPSEDIESLSREPGLNRVDPSEVEPDEVEGGEQ